MKTFELTQEQIERLAEKKHAKELLQEFLPEAFENKLEVGKWHKPKERKNKTLFVPNKEQCDDNMGYGFTYLGKFKESNFNLRGCFPNKFELATEEEVREALINEAKKRGYKIGVKVKSELDSEISEITDDNFEYIPEENALKVKVSSNFYNKRNLFNNGKWMEIIKEAKETEPTKEEINRVLNYLLKNGEKLHMKFSSYKYE